MNELPLHIFTDGLLEVSEFSDQRLPQIQINESGIVVNELFVAGDERARYISLDSIYMMRIVCYRL